MSKTPKKLEIVYIQATLDDLNHFDELCYTHDFTWCWHSIDELDVKFIREDIVEAEKAQLVEALKKANTVIYDLLEPGGLCMGEDLEFIEKTLAGRITTHES